MTRLLFTPGFPPWIGGMPNYMYARCLAAPRDVEVIAASCPGDATFDATLPFPVHRFDLYAPARAGVLNPVRRLVQVARAWTVLNRFLRTGRFDVLECVTVFPGAVAASLLPAGRRVRLIAYALGDDVRRPLTTPWAAPLFRRTLGRVDRLVAISEYTRGLLVAAGVPAERIALVRPPLDRERFARSGDGSAWRAGWPAHSHIVLTLCQLWPNKGVDRVLEAVAALLPEAPDMLYVVAGGGPDRERLESLAGRLGVRERVVFTGRVRAEALPDLYAAADVFVMPTRADHDGSVEGFGIVFLEAGSQGVAVIGPREGGCADAIRDGISGFLVDPDDPADIAARLRTLLADPQLRRRMGEAGRARAFEPTDWSPVTAL